MRSEPGTGTLFSHVIERPNVNVKFAGAPVESNGNKRPLINGVGMYSSLAGAMGSKLNILAQNTHPRLKGGSVGMMLTQEQQPHSSAVGLHSDLCSVERLSELRSRLAPPLQSKAAHSSSLSLSSARPASLPPPHEQYAEETMSLPQWGLLKRARRGRFETVKAHVGGSASLDKSILPLSSADEPVNPSCLHTWTHGCVLEESNSHSSKRGTTAAISRAAGNVFASGREKSSGRGGARAVSSHKSERCILLPRHRSSSSGEANLANNQSNGNTAGGTQVDMAVQAKSSRSEEPENLEWPRILIGLSRKEKEDDFLILKGSKKLPQRPKKRAKVVERALYYCTPGNSLCDLSPRRYDVREKKSVKKRPRGLKAMQSMESESD